MELHYTDAVTQGIMARMRLRCLPLAGAAVGRAADWVVMVRVAGRALPAAVAATAGAAAVGRAALSK